MNESIAGSESEFSPGEEAIQNSVQTAAGYAEQTLEQGKSYIRSNPVPTILGALAIGVVIGLLIPRCEEEEEPVNKLTSKLDDLKELLGSFTGKVSSTAEDQYEGLTSAIGATIKKAKKRFNLP